VDALVSYSAKVNINKKGKSMNLEHTAIVFGSLTIGALVGIGCLLYNIQHLLQILVNDNNRT
jgi:hypothetical protein